MNRKDIPTRATVAGRAYLDLQNLARRNKRPTGELLQLYALEGFLARLAASPHAQHFVLKGGVLLAAYNERRPTTDIDFLARQVHGDTASLVAIVREIAAVHADDGLIIDAAAVAKVIRSESASPCVRVVLTGTLATAQISFHVDVNTGDPVWPAPQAISLPLLLGGHIRLTGYPLAMVYAEKIAASASFGKTNTRWRDFADLYTIPGHHDADGTELCTAFSKVAAHQNVRHEPLSTSLAGFAKIGQQRWAVWLRHQHLEVALPERFGDVLHEVIYFADPVITGDASGLTWNAIARDWRR